MNALALQVRAPQFERGSNALARGLTIGAALDEGEQRRAQAERERRALAENDALNSAYTGALGADGTVDRTKLLTTVAQAGHGSKIPLLHKTFAEQDKAKAELADKQAETTGRGVTNVAGAMKNFQADLWNVRDPASAAEWMKAQYADPVLGPHAAKKMPLERALATIPQDPAQFEPWRMAAGMGMGEYAKHLLERDKHGETVRHHKVGEVETGRHNRTTEGISFGNLTETKRHHGVTEGNQAAALSKPFEVTGPEGVPVLVQQNKAGQLVRVPGFEPKGMGATKLTEDQGKATGWLVQAENAWKNMQDAGMNGDGSIRAAAKPGINDALEQTPIVGGMANALRTADRQKFIQASQSLSEALLRAATGAGVNKEEAAQKVRELTPLWREDEDVTKQKFAAIPKYIESLKVRAGPGAAKATAISAGASTAPTKNNPSADLLNQADAILRGGN